MLRTPLRDDSVSLLVTCTQYVISLVKIDKKIFSVLLGYCIISLRHWMRASSSLLAVYHLRNDFLRFGQYLMLPFDILLYCISVVLFRVKRKALYFTAAEALRKLI